MIFAHIKTYTSACMYVHIYDASKQKREEKGKTPEQEKLNSFLNFLS